MESEAYIISGPFTQLLTMDRLPLRGALCDDQLEIIPNAGIVHQAGKIVETGNFDFLKQKYPSAIIDTYTDDNICLPGMIDAHTHICWVGSRAKDYAMRLSGKTYIEIAEAGGGIWWWWLRSPGRVGVKAVYVHGDGNIGIQGNNILIGNLADGRCTGGVRPALWMRLG